MLLASQLVESSAYELADPEYVRWTVPELLTYLNGGITQLAALKPTLFTLYTPMELAPGSRQSLPGGYTELVDILFNVNPDGSEGPRINQGAFAPARAYGLPACSSPDDYAVRSYTTHPDNDSFFYVNPPVPSSGPRPSVMLLVQMAPVLVNATTDAVVVPNTTPEVYMEVLKDWMLYRAFAKDTESSDSYQRSQAHYKAFMTFVGAPPRDKDAVPVAQARRETASASST